MSSDPTLRLYAVVRSDAGMTPGKAASQAGHAFLGSFLSSQSSRPEVARAYAADLPGTKVALTASYSHLLRAADLCASSGIPHFLVVDSGCPDFFGGEPTVTALGFGPATRDEVEHITKRLRLIP